MIVTSVVCVQIGARAANHSEIRTILSIQLTILTALGQRRSFINNHSPRRIGLYQVGFHYDHGHKYRQSTADILVYFDGELVDRKDREMDVSNFWMPFEIYWPTKGEYEFRFVDRSYDTLVAFIRARGGRPYSL